jgi:voltage-gated potassium channel Kch
VNIDKKYWAIALIFLLGAALSIVGFMEFLQRPPFKLTGWVLWYESLVHTLVLATQPFSDLPGGPENAPDVPWQVSVGRFLIPLSLIYGVVLAVFQVFHRSLRGISSRFARGHVIVCSSGQHGYHFIEHLADEKPKGSLVVIDMDPEDADSEHYHRLQVPVLAGGQPVTEEMLLAAGIERAAAIVALCDNDLLNVELVLRAKEIASARRPDDLPPLRARAAVSDPDMRQACSLMLIDRAPGFEYGLISIPRNTVRRLMADHPLDLDAGVRRGARAHVLVVGFDEIGQELALHVGRNAHFADGRMPLITIAGEASSRDGDAFLRRHPGFAQAAELRAVDIDLRADSFEALEPILGGAPPTRVVICLEHEGLGLSVAARVQRLATRLGVNELPVFLLLAEAPAIAGAIAAGAGARLTHMVPFGQPAKIFTREIVLEESLDLLARAVHHTYLQMIGPDAPQRPSTEPWERLSETFRDASRHQSDHVAAKLRAVGYDVVRGQGASDFVLDADELERLARMEHARWCAERYIAGWRHAPERNDERLEHPSLEPWQALTEGERQKDRDMVLGIPKMLANAGLMARRVAAAP